VDSCQVKQELKLTGIGAILNATVTFLLAAAIPTINWSFWIGAIASFASLIIALIIPIARSYKFQDSTETIIDMNDLRSILKRDAGFKAFLAFLTTEFSTENLLCWRECEEWLVAAEKTRVAETSRGGGSPGQANLSRAELYRRAQDIYDNYLDPNGCPYSVNISSEIRGRIQIEMSAIAKKMSSFSPTQTIFSISTTRSESGGDVSPKSTASDGEISSELQELISLMDSIRAVEKAVFDLMKNDSFHRFKSSPSYSKLEAQSAQGVSKEELQKYEKDSHGSHRSGAEKTASTESKAEEKELLSEDIELTSSRTARSLTQDISPV